MGQTLEDAVIAKSKGFHVDQLDSSSVRNIIDSVINQYHRQETSLRELIQNAIGALATDSHMFFEVGKARTRLFCEFTSDIKKEL